MKQDLFVLIKSKIAFFATRPRPDSTLELWGSGGQRAAGAVNRNAGYHLGGGAGGGGHSGTGGEQPPGCDVQGRTLDFYDDRAMFWRGDCAMMPPMHRDNGKWLRKKNHLTITFKVLI